MFKSVRPTHPIHEVVLRSTLSVLSPKGSVNAAKSRDHKRFSEKDFFCAASLEQCVPVCFSPVCFFSCQECETHPIHEIVLHSTLHWVSFLWRDQSTRRETTNDSQKRISLAQLQCSPGSGSRKGDSLKELNHRAAAFMIFTQKFHQMDFLLPHYIYLYTWFKMSQKDSLTHFVFLYEFKVNMYSFITIINSRCNQADS